ncbi:pentapeptide repeat-containing protein [Halorubrum sp. CBA1229]|uniref:pentapeptide repeat-containing protein n=1 Tax=Halorubrum sp. CBA1229 TaxID=1853699 RepID=UPI000F3EA491|nr:pentapeptide repeat-containing protein [Halorubrum sp. CBA1229]QKY16307.1 pentapeptide repeat-containing protein [Halorubrum sp. CBA1229]
MAVENQCRYTADGDTWVNWGGDRDGWKELLARLNVDGDTWSCPHDALADAQRCQFHDPSRRPDGTDIQTAIEATDRSDDGTASRDQFIGATLGLVNWSHERIGRDPHTPLCFAGATFMDGVSAKNVVFRAPVTFQYGTFSGADVLFTESDFNGHDDVSFAGVTFENAGAVSFAKVDFQNDDDVDFSGSTFENGGEVRFNDTDFANPGGTYFTRTGFKNDGTVSFRQAEFIEDAYFGYGFRDPDTIDFTQASFAQAQLEIDSFAEVCLKRTDFSECTLDNVDFSGANIENARFTGATLRTARFNTAKLDGAIFDNAVVDETTAFIATRAEAARPAFVIYDPRPDQYRRLFGRIRWLVRSVITDRSTETESDWRKAARSYKTLERIGQYNSLSSLQHKGYVYRKEMQRRWHADQIRATRSGIAHAVKYVYATLARYGTHYGESVWHVLGVFATVIGLAALGYVTGASQQSGRTLLESGYYSLLVATGSAPPTFQPTGWTQLIVGGESVLGAVLIALLVFVLGRKTTR